MHYLISVTIIENNSFEAFLFLLSIPYVGYGDNNAPRNIPINEHRDIGIGNFPNESPHSGYIPLEGCCSSRAYQLLSDRKNSS